MKTYSLSLFARLRQWLLHEPLVHFMVLGSLIFGIYGTVVPQSPAVDKRIEVSVDDVARLREISRQQWGKEPDTQTMRDLVQSFVREEVLYREALASGLDRDDAIVRRRLAQKMEFLAHEEVRTPTEEDLRNYFSDHRQQFAQVSTLDVDQVIFEPARRGANTDATLREALQHLRSGQSVRGDSVMQPIRLVQQDREQLRREYGENFAQALFSLPDGAWSGPIRSAMGLHLVRVKHHAGLVGTYEELRPRVLAELTQRRVEQARTDAYARLLSRYTVITPFRNQTAETRVSQL